MADENTDPRPSSPRARRGSLVDLFGGGPRSSMTRPAENNSPPSQPGPITKAAAQAQQRRLSLTTLGISGGPTQTSPFGSLRSSSSVNRDSIDESAIAEDDGPGRDSNNGNQPTTPFARRTSFGAKALRDRMGSFSGQGEKSPGQNGTKSPPASSNTSNRAQSGTISTRGLSLALVLPLFENSSTFDLHTTLTLLSYVGPSNEGFNWSDNFRTRAERTSIAGQTGVSPPGANHSRAKSVAVMEPPPVEAPKPKEKARPDHFQERILKGDFYMD